MMMMMMMMMMMIMTMLTYDSAAADPNKTHKVINVNTVNNASVARCTGMPSCG
jgi:hypothetical protein